MIVKEVEVIAIVVVVAPVQVVIQRVKAMILKINK